jgi:hypothetical protein
MRLLRQTPEHNGTKWYEQNCTGGLYAWFICFCSINHFHILYLYLVCFHFVLFKPEMIYGESTVGAVQVTLCYFVLLCACSTDLLEMFILQKMIFTGALEYSNRRNRIWLPPLPPPPYKTVCTVNYVLCVHKTCASVVTNCLTCSQLQLIFTAVFFPIDSWQERLRAKLHWLLWVGLGGGRAVCLSVSKQCQTALNVPVDNAVRLSLIFEMDRGSPQVWIWTGVNAIPRGNYLNRTFWNDRLIFSEKMLCVCVCVCAWLWRSSLCITTVTSCKDRLEVDRVDAPLIALIRNDRRNWTLLKGCVAFVLNWTNSLRVLKKKEQFLAPIKKNSKVLILMIVLHW